jgi:hypothetical protein
LQFAPSQFAVYFFWKPKAPKSTKSPVGAWAEALEAATKHHKVVGVDGQLVSWIKRSCYSHISRVGTINHLKDSCFIWCVCVPSFAVFVLHPENHFRLTMRFSVSVGSSGSTCQDCISQWWGYQLKVFPPTGVHHQSFQEIVWGKKYDAAVQQILVLISASLGRALKKIPGFLGAPGLDQATGEHE